MAANQYRFVTRWRLDAAPEEVYAVIEDAAGFPRWWPAVWLRVEVIEPGDADGIGQTFRVVSKGRLPYLLHWTGRTTEKVFPGRIALSASGDFAGRGCWTFRRDGVVTEAEYVWGIAATKPLLKYLSFLLKPVFAANHAWAMARGEESLKLELARRRARTERERAAVPPPPPPKLSRRQRQSLGLPAQ